MTGDRLTIYENGGWVLRGRDDAVLARETGGGRSRVLLNVCRSLGMWFDDLGEDDPVKHEKRRRVVYLVRSGDGFQLGVVRSGVLWVWATTRQKVPHDQQSV